MGVVECAKHELLQPFNVLYEKEGESWGEGFSSGALSTWYCSPRNLRREAQYDKGTVFSKHAFVFPSGEFVAQFKFTVLLMPNGPMRITSGPFEPDLYKSELEVQDAELKVSVHGRWWQCGAGLGVGPASGGPELGHHQSPSALALPPLASTAVAFFLLFSRPSSRVLQVGKRRKRRKRRCVVVVPVACVWISAELSSALSLAGPPLPSKN